MQSSFSFGGAQSGGIATRIRMLILLPALVMLGFMAVTVISWKLNSANQMCEGPRCVKITVTFSNPPDYIASMDKRKYQWAEIYKQETDKMLYRGYFNCQNKAVFSVEKGKYYLKTNKQQKRRYILADKDKEIVLSEKNMQ